ncbi:hypothetical protein [Desulfovibrio oxyclinae]|uniref:hypothetical protein n=1 Tax=Desulfovibrio oxyclinae TaxID=63560 RepID=UPI000369BF8B|nr:hypothetical protein [Desulfovibrio oxyclinae]
MTQQTFLAARNTAALAVATSPDIRNFMAREFPLLRWRVYREVFAGMLPPADAAPFAAFGPFSHGQPDKDPHAIEHALPVGVFLARPQGDFQDAGSDIMVMPGAALLDELAALTEKAVSSALTGAGFPFEQDPYLPDDLAQYGDFIMSFYLYRVRTRRYL